MHRKSPWLRSRIWIHKHGWLGGIFIFLVTAALFTWLMLDKTFADPDSFYHARIAQMMSQQGIITWFPYLRYTYLYDHFTDHHLLYHLILVPFVKWLPMFEGAKIATVVLAATLVMIWFYIARSLGGWIPSVVALLLLATHPFDFRIGLTKASALALILLFTGFWLMVKKRYIWLFLLSYLYAWAHGGFAVLWVVCALTGVAILLTEHKIDVRGLFSRHHKWIHFKALTGGFWRAAVVPTMVSFFGSVLGTVFNPYFPNNIRFLWQQVIQIGVVNYQNVITVGAEWYPYPWQFLIPDVALLGIALVGLTVLVAIYWRRMSGVAWASVLLTVFFFVLTLKSRRFIEYAVPWGWLSVTLTLGSVEFRQTIEKNWNGIKKFVLASRMHTILSALLVMYFVVMIPAIAIRGATDNKQQFANGISWTQWERATQWLTDNTPEGSLVFHDDWDGFPQLYAHDPHNTYIVGLDPTFLYLYNQDLYWKFVKVTTGQEEGSLSQIIGVDFHAQYVFVAVDHLRLQNQLRRDEAFEEVYQDDEASVFELK